MSGLDVTDTLHCRQTAMLYCRYLTTESVTTSKYFLKPIFNVFGKEITLYYRLAEDIGKYASSFITICISSFNTYNHFIFLNILDDIPAN